MTFGQLKNFCEKNGVKYEVNTIYSKPWFNPYDCEEHRTVLGFEIGMNNIAGKHGKSEWNWTWFETVGCPETLEDTQEMWFRERYSMLNGRSYKGVMESIQAQNTIERRS